MGATFSRKLTIKDRLLQLESEVLTTEYELNKLKNASKNTLLIISILFVPLAAYFSFILGFSVLLTTLPLVAILVGLYYISKVVRETQIRNKDRKLKNLQDERKTLIEKCKNDDNFSTTRSIIERYDDEQSRSTFFSQLKRKKKSAMDSVTDFVLGSDPSQLTALICRKCGVHNGMIDPKNDDFSVFQCYNCDFVNERKQKVPK